MMIKLFKNIFIVSLCCSFIIVSNAAVSVSDGSAFITKAEFSADLNNLSNRMAQLENSLDAKIDSLVSSYLSKNGIWNASKVDIDYSATNLTSSSFITSWTGFEAMKTKVVWSKSAIVKKSGMCVATVHMQGYKNGTTYYRCYLRYTGGLWAGFEDDSRVVVWLNEIMNGTTYERNVQQIGCSSQRAATGNPQDSGECVVTLPTDNDYVLLAFVTKGSTVQIGITQLVSDFQDGDSSISVWGLSHGSYWQVKIADCNIY